MTCPECGAEFDDGLTHEGTPRRAGVRRIFCSRKCGNRREHRRNGRARRLKSEYGLTAEDYSALERAQGGVCAICERAPYELPGGRSGDGRLYVDHDHDTGRVRGLLCGCCNVVLGMAGESTEVLVAAVRYLQERQHDHVD